MIRLFKRSISYVFLVAILSALLSLVNVTLQFSWLALVVFLVTLLLFFLVFRQERSTKNYDVDSLKCQAVAEQDDLESKVQERTLELNIALQELEEVNRELQEKIPSTSLQVYIIAVFMIKKFSLNIAVVAVI